MIVVSGRRRIGKSRLIDEFLKDKQHIKIQTAQQQTPHTTHMQFFLNTSSVDKNIVTNQNKSANLIR